MSDRVLLTGVSGFLAGHLALQLLQAGYVVRGSVRDLGKSDKVRETLRGAGADTSRLEFVALDLMSDKGWAEAMEGVRYLQHVASPFVTSMPADRMELIRPAVEGTKRALEAAYAAAVERVVLTSSMAAIMYGHDRLRSAPFTAADWTDLDGRDANAYVESKTRAERAAWEIADRHGRRQDLAVINPGAITGPLLDDDPGTSVALVQRLLKGSMPAAPNMAMVLVDVRDVAALHVAAMTSPDAGGHRFPSGDGTFSLMQIADMLRPMLPAYARKLPRFQAPDWLVRIVALVDKDARGNLGELGVIKHADATDARALLGRPFIPTRDSLAETGRSLVARGLI
jgi:dihydroflavonol-4-reductase